MAAELSIVIVTRNAAAVLPATIEPLMEGLRAGLVRDLVIADAGSTDDTLRIADAVGAEVVSGPADRLALLRLGVDAAQGRWVLALTPGARLREGWSDTVGSHLRADGGRACFQLEADGTGGRLRAWAANLGVRLTGRAGPDHGLLCRPSDWNAGGRVRLLAARLVIAAGSDRI